MGIDDGKSSRAEAIHGVGDLDSEALRVSIFEGTELPGGRGSGTRYRLEPSLSDRIRGTTQTNLDLPLDHESVLLRVSSVLEARKTITNAQVRDMTGWSRTKVRRLMDELRNQGKVQSRGKGRGAWWEWVGDA